MDTYETYERNGLTVKLFRDDGWDMNPAEWGNYSIVQFRDNGYNSYGDLDDYLTENGFLTAATRAKLKAGKMFTIDYSSYSCTDGGFYRLDGSIPTEGDLESRDVNGFIIFEDEYVKGVSFEDRRKYAEQDLKEYTSWANGEVYGWSVEDADGNVIESCGGYIGLDSDEEMKREANAVADSIRSSSLAKNAKVLHN